MIFPILNFIMLEKKGEIAKSEGIEYMIEDGEKNIVELLEIGIPIIMPVYSYNQNYINEELVTPYNLSQ